MPSQPPIPAHLHYQSLFLKDFVLLDLREVINKRMYTKRSSPFETN